MRSDATPAAARPPLPGCARRSRRAEAGGSRGGRRCRANPAGRTRYLSEGRRRNTPSETAGKARLHTCVDQYNANKTTNANGDLKWIEKGGGY